MFPHPGLTLAIPIISPTPLQSFLLLTRSIMSGSKRAFAGVLLLGMGLLCLGPVLETKTDTLKMVAEYATSKEASRGLVDLVLPLIADAVDADNYEIALQLGDLAEKAAKKAQNIPLIRTVNEKRQEVLAVQKG